MLDHVNHLKYPNCPGLLCKAKIGLQYKRWIHCKKVFQHGDTEDTEKNKGVHGEKILSKPYLFLLRALCVSVVKVF